MNATTTPEVAEADLEIGDVDTYVARCRMQKGICRELALETMENAFQAHLANCTRMRVHCMLRAAEDHIQGEDYWAMQERKWVEEFFSDVASLPTNGILRYNSTGDIK